MDTKIKIGIGIISLVVIGLFVWIITTNSKISELYCEFNINYNYNFNLFYFESFQLPLEKIMNFLHFFINI